MIWLRWRLSRIRCWDISQGAEVDLLACRVSCLEKMMGIP